MQLGAFSISLTVKDLEISRAFYEEFGFTFFGGDAAQNWLILKNCWTQHKPRAITQQHTDSQLAHLREPY